MKNYAEIKVCPDCNTTIIFVNNNIPKEQLLQILELIKKEIELGNNEFKIYRDKLKIHGS
jgi:uncharacterized protein with PIN domain